MAKYNYTRSQSRGKLTYSNKQKENRDNFLGVLVGGLILGIVLLFTFGTIILFIPSLIITAIINSFSQPNILATNQLWGITLTTSIILMGGIYLKYKERFWETYGIIVLILSILTVLYSLFIPDNILLKTILQMYPSYIGDLIPLNKH